MIGEANHPVVLLYFDTLPCTICIEDPRSQTAGVIIADTEAILQSDDASLHSDDKSLHVDGASLQNDEANL